MISWGGQDAKRLGRPNVHWRKATMNWGAEQLPFNNCEYIKHQVIQHAVDPDEDAIAILFSSGTTSQAKGVVIGYDGEINANEQNRNVKNSGTRYVFVRKKRVQMIRR